MNSIIINACNGFEVPETDVLVIPCSPPLKGWRNKVKLYFRVEVKSGVYGKWDWFLAIVPKGKTIFELVVEEEKYSDIDGVRQVSPSDIEYVRFYLKPSSGKKLYAAMASAEPNCKSK